MGFKLRGNRLSIEPAIPEDWPGYVITFRYGRTEYRIEVQNTVQASRQEIPLEDDRKIHTIRITTGQRQPKNVGHSRHPLGCRVGLVSNVKRRASNVK